jgi:hypothetical protein
MKYWVFRGHANIKIEPPDEGATACSESGRRRGCLG